MLKRSRIFIDDLAQCIHSGEIYQGLEKGIVEKEDLITAILVFEGLDI